MCLPPGRKQMSAEYPGHDPRGRCQQHGWPASPTQQAHSSCVLREMHGRARPDRRVLTDREGLPGRHGSGSVSQGEGVQFLEIGQQRGAKYALQSARGRQRAGVGAGIDALDEAEVRLGTAHHVADADVGRCTRRVARISLALHHACLFSVFNMQRICMWSRIPMHVIAIGARRRCPPGRR